MRRSDSNLRLLTSKPAPFTNFCPCPPDRVQICSFWTAGSGESEPGSLICDFVNRKLRLFKFQVLFYFVLFSKCWQFESQTVFHFYWCLQPGAMGSSSASGRTGHLTGQWKFKASPPPVKHLLVRQESKNSVNNCRSG